MTAAPIGTAPERPATANAALLRVDGVSKRFEGLVAVDGCTFTVQPGAVTGLIGPNGAGKSTLFNLVTGVLRPDGGRISFQGTAISGQAPERIVARGIGRTFQTPRLFLELTVWENLMVAGQGQPGERLAAALLRRRSLRAAERALSRKAHEVLEYLKLGPLTDQAAASLSGGQRKLLSLGRVLMMEPRLILLDEPLAGVNETLAQELFDHIRELNRQGITFLVIEHNLELIMRLSDEIVVMHNGRTLAQGTPLEMQRNQDVLDAYLGGQI